MKKIRSISIDEKIWQLLDNISKKEGRSKSNMLEYLIMNYEKGLK